MYIVGSIGNQPLISSKKFSGKSGVLCPESDGYLAKAGNHGPICPNSRANITTTQIYAEVVDEKKSRAVRLMDGLL